MTVVGRAKVRVVWPVIWAEVADWSVIVSALRLSTRVVNASLV